MTADNTHCPSCNAPLDGTVDRSWNDEANAFLCVPCSFHLRLRANNQSMSDFAKILQGYRPDAVNWFDANASGSAATLQIADNYGNLKARIPLEKPIKICNGTPEPFHIVIPHGADLCYYDRLHFLDADGKEILNIVANEIFKHLPVHQITEMKPFTMQGESPK